MMVQDSWSWVREGVDSWPQEAQPENTHANSHYSWNEQNNTIVHWQELHCEFADSNSFHALITNLQAYITESQHTHPLSPFRLLSFSLPLWAFLHPSKPLDHPAVQWCSLPTFGCSAGWPTKNQGWVLTSTTHTWNRSKQDIMHKLQYTAPHSTPCFTVTFPVFHQPLATSLFQFTLISKMCYTFKSFQTTSTFNWYREAGWLVKLQCTNHNWPQQQCHVIWRHGGNVFIPIGINKPYSS